jgi:hypothetical protein
MHKRSRQHEEKEPFWLSIWFLERPWMLAFAGVVVAVLIALMSVDWFGRIVWGALAVANFLHGVRLYIRRNA